jgi:hydrogenase nickel incorporation protein HypA/HybF
MHEFSAASEIVEVVTKTAKVHKSRRVKEVTLVIGKLSLFNIDQIKFSYDILSKGTPLEGSKLVVEEREAKVKCEKCGYKGPISMLEDSSYHFFLPSLQCPKCGKNVAIVEGRECLVKTIKMVK